MSLKQRAITFLNNKKVKGDFTNRVVVKEDNAVIFISDLMAEFTNEQMQINK